MLVASSNHRELNSLVPIDDSNLMSPEFGSPALTLGDFCASTYKIEPSRAGPVGNTPMHKLVQALLECPQ